MSNDGLRFVIDRREGKYYWQFTEFGEEHKSGRGYSSILEAASEADLFRRQIELGRHIKAKRLAASQSI